MIHATQNVLTLTRHRIHVYHQGHQVLPDHHMSITRTIIRFTSYHHHAITIDGLLTLSPTMYVITSFHFCTVIRIISDVSHQDQVAIPVPSYPIRLYSVTRFVNLNRIISSGLPLRITQVYPVAESSVSYSAILTGQLAVGALTLASVVVTQLSVLLILNDHHHDVLGNLLRLVFHDNATTSDLTNPGPIKRAKGHLLITLNLGLSTVITTSRSTTVYRHHVTHHRSHFVRSHLIVSFSRFYFGDLDYRSTFVTVSVSVTRIRIVLIRARFMSHTVIVHLLHTVSSRVTIAVGVDRFHVLLNFHRDAHSVTISLLRAVISFLVSVISHLGRNDQTAN